MKGLISLGDYLSDLGYSPTCHQKVIDLINNFNGSNYTIHNMVDPSDEELEELINQAIEQWNLNEFSFQDICGDYGLLTGWFGRSRLIWGLLFFIEK